jgi:hypothetical protein
MPPRPAASAGEPLARSGDELARLFIGLAFTADPPGDSVSDASRPLLSIIGSAERSCRRANT